LTQADIDALTQAVLDVDLDPIIEAYTNIIAKLAVRGVVLTDRRVVRAQKLFAAAAVLAGRDVASTADLWPIVYLVQDRTLQAQVKELLAEELKLGENKVLSDAVKTAAYGPAAYAVDLVADAQKHLDSKPKLADDPGYEAWLIRAEGILARIDAGFDDETRTEALTVMRSALRAMIE
jgi:MoxR-like ATPase